MLAEQLTADRVNGKGHDEQNGTGHDDRQYHVMSAQPFDDAVGNRLSGA